MPSDGRAHIAKFVMPGLVPGIHVFNCTAARKTWMAGTSPAMTKKMDSTLAGKSSRQHLLQDLPADALVGERGVAPPPAVLLHLLGRRDKTLRYFSKIPLGVVQAENQAAGSDPAQCELLEAQIILKHPIVAGRLGVMDHPDRRQVADPHRQVALGQHVVQPPRPL